MIRHQIKALNEAGVRKICVVVGYEADTVLQAVGNAAVCQFNERYSHTNSLYSLWLTREWMEGPFVMMNSDLIVDPEIISKVVSGTGSIVSYDSSSAHDDEQMNVSFHGEVLQQISKQLSPRTSQGENVGVIRFDAEAAELLFSVAGEIVAEGGENEWAPEAVNRLTSKVMFRGLDVAGIPWTEIDYPADLEYARRSVWPTIVGGGRGRRRDVAPESEIALPS